MENINTAALTRELFGNPKGPPYERLAVDTDPETGRWSVIFRRVSDGKNFEALRQPWMSDWALYEVEAIPVTTYTYKRIGAMHGR